MANRVILAHKADLVHRGDWVHKVALVGKVALVRRDDWEDKELKVALANKVRLANRVALVHRVNKDVLDRKVALVNRARKVLVVSIFVRKLHVPRARKGRNGARPRIHTLSLPMLIRAMPMVNAEL